METAEAPGGALVPKTTALEKKKAEEGKLDGDRLRMNE